MRKAAYMPFPLNAGRALLLAAALFLAHPALGRDPTWATDPGRNMVLEAENVPVKLTEENLLWKVDSKTSHQYPMPAIVGDKVLIGGNARGNPDPYWGKAVNRGGSLVCRRLSDGEQIWRLHSGDTHRQGGFGVCGSPLVEGNRVYVQSVHRVYCLDLEGMANGNQGVQNELELMMHVNYSHPEGMERPTELPAWAADVIWHYSFLDMRIQVQDAISCTPLMINDQIWISTANEMGHLARGGKSRKTGEWQKPEPKPHLLVLDKQTGELIAKDNMRVPIIWHGEWSSPSAVTVNGETCVIFGDGYGVLHGFALPEKSEDGEPVILEELWSFDLNPKEYRYDEEGREHPYHTDTRLIYKFPLDWLRDEEKWILPPEAWAEYKKKDGVESYRDVEDLSKVRFRPWKDRNVKSPTSLDGPAELIAMPVVIDNRVYVGIGRDFNYSGGNPPEEREFLERRRARKFSHGRFMCLEFHDVKKAPRVVWEDRDIAHTQSNASVHEGYVYVCDLGGFLNCWDAETGEVVYKIDIRASMRERSQMVTDDKIYVANDFNEFLVYTTGPDPQLLAMSEVEDWISTPCPEDGVLVFTTSRHVFAYGNTEDHEQETEE